MENQLVCNIPLLKLKKIMGRDLRRCNFVLSSVCSADLDILCSGSFSHHIKVIELCVYTEDFHPGGLCKW